MCKCRVCFWLLGESVFVLGDVMDEKSVNFKEMQHMSWDLQIDQKSMPWWNHEIFVLSLSLPSISLFLSALYSFYFSFGYKLLCV